MTERRNERVVYLNGEIVPESQATLSFRDAGFVYGDGLLDTARTFRGEVFRLKQHIDRLYDTLAYVRIDPGMTKEQMTDATDHVVAMNRHLLGPDDDYWVSQRISRGQIPVDGETPARDEATVVIECTPLPLRARAPMYRDGIDAVISSLRRVPPSALSPNAKTNNYMNMRLAQREVTSYAPGSWAVLLDENGNVCEGAGCNIFIVKADVVATPSTDYILAGITRDAVLELRRHNDIPVEERTVSLHQAWIADEAFFASSALCVCPLRSLNGRTYGAVPGPVTKRLMDLFAEVVGVDYVAQYLKHLSDTPPDAGF